MPRILFWTLAGATLALYLTMLAWSLPTVSAGSGGLAPFDMRPGGYSFEEARQFLASLTPAAARFYREVQHALDIAYPALNALTLFLAIAALLPRRLGAWRFACAAPALLVAPLDWLENGAVALMLDAGADGVTAQMVATASGWTQLKSTATAIAMSAVLLLLVVKAGRAWAGRLRQRNVSRSA